MATLTLTAEDFKWFAKTLKYASLQISNILFQRQVGYFDPAFEGMPLLHTWSLGVEEQFYLIWPVMLLLLFKFKKCKNIPFYGLITISIISLLFSQYLINIDQQRISFFSLPSRLWELGLGGILAFNKIKQPENNKINESLGILGLVLIAISIFTIKNDSFPGLMALLPCLGAGLVIFSGNKEKTTITAKILSIRPLVFIGLISYSLYLWHWPIITFYKEYSGQVSLSVATAIIISLISIIISYFSWKFIENPFRKRKKLKDETTLYLAIGRAKNKTKQFRVNLYNPMLIALVLIISFTVTSKHIRKTEWNWRMVVSKGDSSVNIINDISQSDCDKNINPKDNFIKCTIGTNKEKPEVLLFGDSHAQHYATPVIEWAKKRGMSVLMISGGGCPGIVGVSTNSKDRPCNVTQDTITKTLKQNNFKYIFLASRWSMYIDDSKMRKDFLVYDIKSNDKDYTIEKSKKVFAEKLGSTVRSISKHSKVVMLGEVPFAGDRKIKTLNKQYDSMPILGYLSKTEDRSSKRNICESNKNCAERIGFINSTISKIANDNSNVIFFDPSSKLCDKNLCHFIKEDKMLYKDGDHLNINGAHYVGKYFDFKFK